MAIELSAILSDNKRLVDWASAVKYNGGSLSEENKEISAKFDAWARELGKTGDPQQEIANLVRKSITPETIEAPSYLIDAMFDTDAIGEFDDYIGEVEPKNTVQVYEGGRGGNVDRSFIDHRLIKPTWVSLVAETDVKLKDIRRGGYKSIANMITNINEALEVKKITTIFNIVDTAITSGAAGCITESGTLPTTTSAEALADYLHEVSNGETPIIFGLMKYQRAMAKLAGADTFGSDEVKNMYNQTGFVNMFSGCEVLGYSGQKKLPNGSLVVPDKRMFGIAGKVGKCITRGTTNVLQSTDINNETVHIKVSGYEFGTLITDVSKIGKLILN